MILQTYCNTIDNDHGCLILKKKLHNAIPLKQILFLQFSRRQPPFYSQVISLPIFGQNSSFFWCSYKRLKIYRSRNYQNFIESNVQNRCPSFQLLKQQKNDFIFTESFDPNPQVQYLHATLENITMLPIANPTGIIGYLEFPQDNHELQPPPQPL